MGEQQVASRKGEMATGVYDHCLPKTFNSFGSRVFSVRECVALLREDGAYFDNEAVLIKALFAYREREDPASSGEAYYQFAGPFQMQDVLRHRFQFNLKYQDNVIKTELEKSAADDSSMMIGGRLNQVLEKLLRAISIVLRTAFFADTPLYYGLTNAELDSVVLSCLALLEITERSERRAEALINAGNVANELANLVQSQIIAHQDLGLRDILLFLVYSGVVWWSKASTQQDFAARPRETVVAMKQELTKLAQNGLAINDSAVFVSEVLAERFPRKLLYFLDDNGELVWHLLFIHRLFDLNPNLEVVCVVNRKPVTNNVNLATLQHQLENCEVGFGLMSNPRFSVQAESNQLTAPDLRFASRELKAVVEQADVIFVNGVSYFEKLQYLPVPTYYAFTVHSNTSRLLTGLAKHQGVFVRIPPHLCGFDDVRDDPKDLIVGMPLKAIHKAVTSRNYQRLRHKYGSEDEMCLWIKSEAQRHRLTCDRVIWQYTG